MPSVPHEEERSMSMQLAVDLLELDATVDELVLAASVMESGPCSEAVALGVWWIPWRGRWGSSTGDRRLLSPSYLLSGSGRGGWDDGAGSGAGEVNSRRGVAKAWSRQIRQHQ